MNTQFHPNQIFYVKDIGYARIIVEKNTKQDQKINQEEVPPTIIKTLSWPKQQPNQQDEDVQFDPDMFNIQPERTVSKNGQQVSGELINISNQRRISMDNRQTRETARQIKIVGLKLQNTNVQIFAEQSLLLRKINLQVKAMLHNQRKQIQIQIDIIKTIDVLKTYIFDKLGEQIGYYSDIRIFATTPSLQEVNVVGSKTIWQCGLKSNSRLVVTGKFNFAFKNLQAEKSTFYTLSNGDMTVIGAMPVKNQEVAVQGKISNQEINIQIEATSTTTNVTQQTNNATITTKIQQIVTKTKTKEKQIYKEDPLNLYCNGNFSTGMHYWQIKLQKIQQLKSQKALLFLGICLKDNQNKLIAYWGYDPIKLKKVHLIPQKKQLMDERQSQEQDQNSSDDQYGAKVKNGDIIGVLLILQQKFASLVFYKNSICFQECHKIDMQKFQAKRSISPFVMVRGECQLTLDSKAKEPLDVCRRK